MKFTHTIGRNAVIANISIYEKLTDGRGDWLIGDIQLPPDVTDHALERAARQIVAVINTVNRVASERSVKEVRTEIRKALGV